MCSCFFIFFLQRLPTVSFSSSFSPSPLSLHILHNSSFFFFTKTSLSSLFLSLSDSHFLKLLHLLQWHPRPRSPSTSFLLMHSTSPVGKGGGGMRLMGPPPLTYWLENHIPMAESVSFQTFLIFQVSLLSSILMCFFAM